MVARAGQSSEKAALISTPTKSEQQKGPGL
jgi:hypothetical protein